MDSRFLRNTLLVTFLFMVLVFVTVLYSNGYLTKKSPQKAEPVIVETQETEPLINYSAWMEDETFFDAEEKKYSSLEEDSAFLSLLATSIEKDLRIKVVDLEGTPVEGESFRIQIQNQGEYRDLDKDGIIYVADLDPGEYEVSLLPMEGFRMPSTPLKVKVKSRVEYIAIDDISLLIKTEAEIDAENEDGEKPGEEDTGSGSTTFLSQTEGAKGIDVSKWNGEIDWRKVKDAGVEFAFIRVGYRGSTSGYLVEDPYFKQNVEGAKTVGIPIGIYFFTQATSEVEAVEEASMVLTLCKDISVDYPIFIDSESAGGKGRADNLKAKDRTKYCLAFCQTLQNRGYESGIYASKNWFLKQLELANFTDDTLVWLAEYADAPTYGGHYDFWQHTSSGRINGIEGRVDLNVSHWEKKELPKTIEKEKKDQLSEEDEDR